MKNDIAIIILAAGRGTRMNSQFSKVLHKVGDKTLIERTHQTLKRINPAQTIAVIGYDADSVKKVLGSKVDYALQEEQLGTAHAVQIGLEKVAKNVETVLVLNGDDSAFYKHETIEDVLRTHQKNKATITFVTLETENPSGLGRIVRKNGKLLKIAEEKEADENEKKIKEVNDGLYIFNKKWLSANINKIQKSQNAKEYYLVDLIKLAIGQKEKVDTYKLKDPQQWHGVNTLADLQKAHIKFANKIHIMGICGAGASAVAGIAKGYGYQVSGCDLKPDSPYVKNLQIKIEKGHSKNHVKNIDMLITSPAIEKLDPKNEEIKQAKQAKIPTLSWQKFQGEYLQLGKYVITVAGAYGKSTTTSMISQMLTDANLDPTCEVGAKVVAWDQNFRVGKSEYYVCESDEYNNNFLNYKPDIAVILNTAWDHPDFFKSRDDVLESYRKFIQNIKPNGYLIVPNNFDAQELIEQKRDDVKVVHIGDFGEIDLQIIGDFRKQNANAAITVANILGIDINIAKKSLEDFKGVGRRLEPKGEIQNVQFYDDYAVQPYTVLETSNALKKKFQEKRVILVFEPHTFSRINTFFADFIKSLQDSNVNQVLVTDVYGAREKGNPKELAKKIAAQVGLKSVYTGTLEQTAKYVKKNMNTFDVVCSMGAGDSYKLYDLVNKLI